MSTQTTPPNDDAAPAVALRHRKRLLGGLAAVVALGGAAWGVWWLEDGNRWVSTDDAYTAAEIAQVTPAVGGTVREVMVVDTQVVHRNDVLATIDDADARLTLQQAEAELDRAVRRVRGYLATDAGLTAQVAGREADVSHAEAQAASAVADLNKAETELARRRRLAPSGSVSAEELARAETTRATADATLKAAKAGILAARASRTAAIGSRDVNQALIAGVEADANPEVILQRAKRDQAKIDLDRTVLRAPVDGVVARRSVQVGQRVAPGAVLMTVVPIIGVHVDANFKEGQLAKVAVGQAVELVSDVHGSEVVYHGVVAGFSGGTGAVFAAIPAQNASGNWIKVVQRLPVRIDLDPKELAAHPLQVGLSMTVRIDTVPARTSPHANAGATGVLSMSMPSLRTTMLAAGDVP